jgi:hypothetical protein
VDPCLENGVMTTYQGREKMLAPNSKACGENKKAGHFKLFLQTVLTKKQNIHSPSFKL